jgi:hypothetical protein
MKRFTPEQNPGSSLQAVGTPPALLDAIERRYGPIVFDLSAHRANHVCPRYYAPARLVETWDPKLVAKGKDSRDLMLERLIAAGADPEEAGREIGLVVDSKDKAIVSVMNHDRGHEGFDGLTQDWRKIGPGLKFANPEYSDIAPWAKKCHESRERVALLVPLTCGNWAAEHVHGRSLVHGLRPRLVFVGHTRGYPKDLMLAMFGLPGNPTGFECWKWNETGRELEIFDRLPTRKARAARPKQAAIPGT